MFPACAGMNRKCDARLAASDHVPRVRGDEPAKEQEKKKEEKCSPRARG